MVLSHIVHYQWSGQMAPKGIDNTILVINNSDQAEHLITGQFRVVTSRAGIDPAKWITMQITIVYQTILPTVKDLNFSAKNQICNFSLYKPENHAYLKKGQKITTKLKKSRL